MSTQRETDLPMLHAGLVVKAMQTDNPVTETRRVGGDRFIYSAAWYDDETCWRCDIKTDPAHEGFASTVTFSKCYPTASHDTFQKWSPLVTGRLSGPKKLTAWRALFVVFDAALEYYEAEQ